MDLVWKSASFQFDIASKWMADRGILSVQLSSAYILLVFLGRKYMQDREPMKLNKFLIGWNLLLAVFSIYGTLMISSEFFSTVKLLGFRSSYCRRLNYYEGENGYWVFLFVLSKALELGDSFFLVLRKRPLIFLHWYHHASVLVMCWLSYPAQVASLRWGAWMNFTVHAFMYTYFLFRSLQISLPSGVAQAITSIQILQFIVGTFVTFDVLYRTVVTKDCESNLAVAVLQAFLYISYLGLFCQFFHRVYIQKSKKKMQ